MFTLVTLFHLNSKLKSWPVFQKRILSEGKRHEMKRRAQLDMLDCWKQQNNKPKRWNPNRIIPVWRGCSINNTWDWTIVWCMRTEQVYRDDLWLSIRMITVFTKQKKQNCKRFQILINDKNSASKQKIRNVRKSQIIVSNNLKIKKANFAPPLSRTNESERGRWNVWKRKWYFQSLRWHSKESMSNLRLTWVLQCAHF